MKKLVICFSVIIVVLCISIGFTQSSFFPHFSLDQVLHSPLRQLSLEESITQDLNTIKRKTIPNALLSLDQVYWLDHRFKKSVDISKFFSRAFPITSSGKYSLQIDCFNGDISTIIVQMSFFEKKTGNKIYEISRTYQLSDSSSK
jgi:hypothetical protein